MCSSPSQQVTVRASPSPAPLSAFHVSAEPNSNLTVAQAKCFRVILNFSFGLTLCSICKPLRKFCHFYFQDISSIESFLSAATLARATFCHLSTAGDLRINPANCAFAPLWFILNIAVGVSVKSKSDLDVAVLSMPRCLPWLLCNFISFSFSPTHFVPITLASSLFLDHTSLKAGSGLHTCCSLCLEFSSIR